LQEGVQKGEATLLLRLLERRFGPLPDDITSRVHAAATTVLEEWGLRVLDAENLAEVFGDAQT
jgi:trimethylamine:corrinoid methyltransferase-like protein